MGALLFVAIFAIADVGLGFVAGHFLPRPDNAHVQPLANGLVMNCINLFAVAVATASWPKSKAGRYSPMGCKAATADLGSSQERFSVS